MWCKWGLMIKTSRRSCGVTNHIDGCAALWLFTLRSHNLIVGGLASGGGHRLLTPTLYCVVPQRAPLCHSFSHCVALPLCLLSLSLSRPESRCSSRCCCAAAAATVVPVWAKKKTKKSSMKKLHCSFFFLLSFVWGKSATNNKDIIYQVSRHLSWRSHGSHDIAESDKSQKKISSLLGLKREHEWISITTFNIDIFSR